MTPRLPLALVATPLLTLLSLAFSIMSGFGGERLVYARVWGGPPLGTLSVRVQVVEEEGGLARGLPEVPITIELESPPSASVREMRTGEDGLVEALLPLPPLPGSGDRAHLDVRLTSAASLPLASGLIAWSAEAWSTRGARVSGLVPTATDSALPIAVRFQPPVLSAPFPGEVELELEPSAPAPLQVQVEVHGARLLSSSELTLVPGRAQRVSLVPTEHTGTLSLALDSPLGRTSRSVTLPVRAGSLTAAVRGDDLIISSPVPRPRAYYSVVTPGGRLGGGVVVLGPRSDGTAAGRLARGDLPPAADRYLVLSSSADGHAPSLVGLPLDGQTSTFDARDVLLLDGRPGVLRAARAAQARLRFVLSCYAGLGGALSLGLFVWHIRRANERLRLELAVVGAPTEARDRSLFGPISALLSLLFAFGLALTWILVR